MPGITLTHTYFLAYDQKQRARSRPYPPLATLQVASLLRERGHAVSLFDAMLAEGVEGFAEHLARHHSAICILYEDNYNFLSKMCLAKMSAAACRMVEMAKRAGATVIVSGSDASDSPGRYLECGADVVLLGEGIETLVTLVGRLSDSPPVLNGALVGGLDGIAFRSPAGMRRVDADRARARETRVGRPAWDLVDIQAYRRAWHAAHGYFSLNMAASRGCPFRCNWCAKPIWGNAYLQREPEEVAQEMALLKRHCGPDHIWFADDIFGMRPAWIERFAAQVRALDASIPFTIQSRADLLGDRAVAALREAGCREVWIGAESGSQKVLDAMDKDVAVAEVTAARERLRQAGIRGCFFIQLGYLGETLADILATRTLIRDAAPDDIGVSVAYPLPGTRFHDKVSAGLGEKTHWEESDDLDMMFQGTYRSDFYRAVRDLLHEEARLLAGSGGRQAGSQDCAPDTPADPGQRAVDERWRALIAEEKRYRKQPCIPILAHQDS